VKAYSAIHTPEPGNEFVNQPRQSARRGLDRLIATLGIEDLLNTKIPVDLEKLGRHFGARSIKKVNIPAAGMLVPIDNQFLILVNKNDWPMRQRFSSAHEIAHAAIDPKYQRVHRRLPLPSKSRLERTCENLAAMFLMPNPSFSNFLQSYGPSLLTITKLARLFVTSIQATAIRFVDVIDEPCMLIVSKLRGGSSGRNLRIVWSHQNTVKPTGKPMYFVPRNKSIQLTTARLAFHSGQVQSDVEEINIGDLQTKARTESKSFGRGDNRYVLTLVFPNG
jgi:Zn-dependent peptidase ImmA (M78 family)